MSAPQQPPALEKFVLCPDQERFIQQRQYMQNVSSATVEWYNHAFKAFKGCTTAQEYQSRIVALRDRGVTAVSVNTWLRVINTYLDRQSARAPGDSRTGVCCTSARHWIAIERGVDVEAGAGGFGQSPITVMGKGRKERKVPITLEGRKVLFRWMRQLPQGDYVFPSTVGTPLEKRHIQRDLKQVCKRAGITGVRCSPHTLRHTLAVTYLRRGGNLEYLRRILGHSSILVTQRYLQSLTPEDLQQVHNHFSPLAR
jgi:integrase-like protein